MSGHTTAVAAAAPRTSVVEAMIGHVVDVTRDVFQTMVDRAVEFQAPTFGAGQPVANVVGTVGFAGSVSGYLSLCVSNEAALEITQALLGTDLDDAPSHIRDTVGEMTNMITGSVRSLMADSGETMGISTPIVTMGSDFSTVPPRDALQVVCTFTMGAHTLNVHLVIQGTGASRR